MRAAALRPAALDERELRTLDVGAGTGFTTEGIVAARRRRAGHDARPEPAPARPRRGQAGAGARREGAGRRRGPPLPRPTTSTATCPRAASSTGPSPSGRSPRPTACCAPSGRAALIGPVRPGHPLAARGWRRRGCCSPPRRSTATGSTAAGFADVALEALAPDWYRSPRGPYAVAVSGRKPAPGPRRCALGPLREHARAPRPGSPSALRFALRFAVGSLAGALFVPLGAALGAAAPAARAVGAVSSPAAGGHAARGATVPARAAALWRFTRPHTIIGTAASIVGLYVIVVDSLPGVTLAGGLGDLLDARRRLLRERLHRRRQPARGRRDRPRQQAVPAARERAS